MALYRKIACHIWTDPEFRKTTAEQKLQIIEDIVFNRITGYFQQYAGPAYRIADQPKRRPDLSSATWRALRLEVIEEQGTICRYCKSDCSDDPTVDHVVAVCQGGALYDKKNLVVCCRPCNSHKGGKEGWE